MDRHIFFTFVMLLLAACTPQGGGSSWRGRLEAELPLMGHRNWIAVVDSAYPAQVGGGLEIIVTGADHLEVVKAVLEATDEAPHVRPVVFLDEELDWINPKDAPGIDAFKRELEELLKGRNVQRSPHGDIIGWLGRAAESFRVLILKTELTLPYTSVFLMLDCGYWSDEAEKRLRSR